MNLIAIAAGVLSFTVYGVAMRRHFRIVDRVPARMRVTGILFLTVGAAHVATLALTPLDAPRLLAGLSVYISALAIFTAAARSSGRKQLTVAWTPDAPTALICDGVYAEIRHPFYVAYCLTWFAGALTTWSAVLLMTAVLMTGVYVTAARFEEAKFVASPFADSYARYRRQTGMFFPQRLPGGGMARVIAAVLFATLVWGASRLLLNGLDYAIDRSIHVQIEQLFLA